MEYSERTLAPEAIDYIRERLLTGKTLAGHLLETLNLQRGSVITFLPSSVSERETLQFEEAALPRPDPSKFHYYTDAEGRSFRTEPVPNTDPWLVSIIQPFLAGDENRVCIFEEWTSHSSDAHWSTNKSDIVTFVEGEVYYVLLSGDAETRIRKAVRQGGGAWPGLLAAMTSMPAREPISSETRGIRRTQLKTLAERTECLAVGAYDGESYLVWNKAKA